MRTIKFRAWRKDWEIKEMLYFDLKNLDDYFVVVPFTDLRGCEIMQFTGLKDKNGKEIYEGDIIVQEHWNGGDGLVDPDHTDEFEGIVIYEMSGFGIQTKCCKDGETEVVLLENSEFIKSEIIGNIHQNPELLK